MKKAFSAQHGFSLVEVLVAAVIASIIIVMVYTSYKTTLHTIKDITGYADFYENLNLALNKIDRDISNTFINRENKHCAFVCEQSGESSRLNFITVTSNAMRFSGSPKSPAPVSDIREVGYHLREDKNHIGVYNLIRREQVGYDDDITRGGSEDIILQNVKMIKFEFKMRNDWAETWDSRENKRFPDAIRVTIGLKNYKNKEEEFSFITLANMK